VEALGDVAPILEARLGFDVERCPNSRDEERGVNLVTVDQKLDVQREFVGDTKSVSMRCVGIVGLRIMQSGFPGLQFRLQIAAEEKRTSVRDFGRSDR